MNLDIFPAISNRMHHILSETGEQRKQTYKNSATRRRQLIRSTVSRLFSDKFDIET